MTISYCSRCNKGFYQRKKWYDLCEECFQIEKKQEVAVECKSCGMFSWRIPSKSHYKLCKNCWIQSCRPRKNKSSFKKIKWEKIKSEKIPVECSQCGMITWKNPKKAVSNNCKFCIKQKKPQHLNQNQDINKNLSKRQKIFGLIGIILLIIFVISIFNN